MQVPVITLLLLFGLALPASTDQRRRGSKGGAGQTAGGDPCDAPCRCNELLGKLVRTTTVYKIIAAGGDTAHLGERPGRILVSSDHQDDSGLLVKISHTTHPNPGADFDAALAWLRIDYAAQMIYEPDIFDDSAPAHPQRFDSQLLRRLTDSCRSVDFSVFE